MTLLPTALTPGSRPLTAVEREAAQYRQEDRYSLSTALGLFLTLVAVVIGSRTMRDNSLLTHMATGDLILDRLSVPTADPYSRIAAGQDWTVQSWLVSVLYAVADRTVGSSGVRALHGVVAGGVALTIWQLVRPAGQVVPRLALAIIPIAVGTGLWAPRPLMFGLLAMALVLQVVQLERPLWWLVPVMWLWVNSHGSFPLGVALLLAVAIGVSLDGHRGARERAALMWCLAGTALGAVNPIGPSLLVFPAHMLGRRQALEQVVEWQAPSFTRPTEWAFLLVIPLVVLAAKRGAGWRALLPSVCFALGGLLALRNLAVASIVIVAMLAPVFRDFYGTEYGRSASAISRALVTAALAGLGLTMTVVLTRPGLDLTLYPVDEVDHLEQRGLVANETVGLIHREAVGNYLTYRFGDAASVFIDDRFDFHPLSVTDDHLTLVDGGDYADVLDRRRADVVLWSNGTSFASWLTASDRWEMAIENDDWIVACRVESATYRVCMS
jgi:hypothetical protein